MAASARTLLQGSAHVLVMRHCVAIVRCFKDIMQVVGESVNDDGPSRGAMLHLVARTSASELGQPLSTLRCDWERIVSPAARVGNLEF